MNTPTVRDPGLEYMSLDDFEELLADQPEGERWELIGGRVVRMMVGARWEHNYIVQNLAGGLRDRLRAAGSPCRTLVETFRLRPKHLDSSLLPDVIVHCGPLDPGATSLDTPSVLVEVLSKGTEGRDRYEKWAIYKRLPSLQNYVLVARDTAFCEVFSRVGDVWAGSREVEGLHANLDLPAIGVSLPLADIYRDVLSA